MQPDHSVPRPFSKYTISLWAGEREEGMQSQRLAQVGEVHLESQPYVHLSRQITPLEKVNNLRRKASTYGHVSVCVVPTNRHSSKSVLHKRSSPAKDPTQACRTFHSASTAWLSNADNHQRMTDAWGRVRDMKSKLTGKSRTRKIAQWVNGWLLKHEFGVPCTHLKSLS